MRSTCSAKNRVRVENSTELGRLRLDSERLEGRGRASDLCRDVSTRNQRTVVTATAASRMKNPTMAVNQTVTGWMRIQTTIVSRARDIGDTDGRFKFKTRIAVVYVYAASSNRGAVSTRCAWK